MVRRKTHSKSNLQINNSVEKNGIIKKEKNGFTYENTQNLDAIDNNKVDKVDKSHYYANPSQYEPVFHERIIPYTSLLVNGMYWDARFPRLLSKEQVLTQY